MSIEPLTSIHLNVTTEAGLTADELDELISKWRKKLRLLLTEFTSAISIAGTDFFELTDYVCFPPQPSNVLQYLFEIHMLYGSALSNIELTDIKDAFEEIFMESATLKITRPCH